MEQVLKYVNIAYAPEGDGGAAAPAAAAATAPPAAAPALAAAALGAVTPAAASAPAAGAAPNAAADYWPEGLDPKLKGADAKASMDNVTKALNGYRERDAKRDVPETVDGYLKFDGLPADLKIDPKNQPYFDTLATDPAFKSIAAEAHKRGIGRADMVAMYQAGLNTMAEAGMLQAPVNAAAERASLLPEEAKSLPKADQDKAIQGRLQANYDFLDLMQTNKGLPKDVAHHMELMLGDSAMGHKALEWVRSTVQGGGTAMPGAIGSQSGAVTKESLRAERQAIQSNDPQRKQKEAALDEKYKAHYGQ